MKTWLSENGWKFQARFKDISQCVRCKDVGVLRVKIEECGFLAKCNCEIGKGQMWKLPVYYEVSDQWSFVPPGEFLPKKRVENSSEVFRHIREKMSWWREKIRLSEEYFKGIRDGKEKDK